MTMFKLLTENLFFASALIVSLVPYLRARPPKLLLALTLCCGLTASGLFAGPAEWYVRIMLALDYCSLAALVFVLMAPYLRLEFAQRGELLLEMLFPPVSAILSALCLALLALSRADTLDRYLYAFDGSLGFQPGFWGARFLLQHNGLLTASEIAYRNLPLALGLVYYLLRERSRQMAQATLRLYLGIAMCGYAAYYFFPAAGSGVVFGNAFPFHPPALQSMRIAPAPAPFAPRNCMPSLHAAWALALFWSSLLLPRAVRAAAGLFAGLTLLYALSQHYLVDFVVAVPFTLAIYAATRPWSAWRQPAIRVACMLASLLFLTWLVALRWWIAGFIDSTAVAWSAVLLSSSACVVLKTRMESALLNRASFDALPNRTHQSADALLALEPDAIGER